MSDIEVVRIDGVPVCYVLDHQFDLTALDVPDTDARFATREQAQWVADTMWAAVSCTGD